MTRDNDTLGDMASLLAALVSIDSVNPDLVPDGAGERAVADAIAQWGSAAGLEVETLTEHPERPSVVVRARGSGGGGTLLLCGHIDTVGVAGMTEPFDARVDGDRLHGRGAYDMKGGVAAALLACRDAAALGLAGDVVVAAVADEEHASVGVREVLRHVRADAAIVTEPTELEVAIAHRGFVWIEIEVRGRAAHGSRPRLGVDAIAHAGPILTGIGDLDSRLAERPHPLLDRGSIHASLIEGGTELSSYPDRCRISLERRTLPGEASASVEAEIEEILAGTRGRVPGLDDLAADVARSRAVRDRRRRRARGDRGCRRVRERALAVHRGRQLLGGRRVHRRGGNSLRPVRPRRRGRARDRGVGQPLELRGRAGDARRRRQARLPLRSGGRRHDRNRTASA